MNLKLKSLATQLFVAAALVVPAAVQAQNYPPLVGDYVKVARQAVRTIDMAGFKALYDKKEAGLIVDVREADEVADGMIPGAVHVPRGLLEFTIWQHVGFPNAIDMNKQISLYCKTGGRCSLAAKSLQDLGFRNVTAVVMKIEDWQKAGYPMVKPK
jgi:rhodanese-related sulfurtransferase